MAFLRKYGFFLLLALFTLALGAGARALRGWLTAAPSEERAQAASAPTAVPLIDPLVPSRAYSPAEQEAVYWNDALGQWQGRDGEDLYAPEGSAVYAMHAGVVTRMYADPLLGNCLLLTGDGTVTLYGCLADESPRAVGDSVRAGDLLGSVGAPGLSEEARAHLHLCLSEP